MENKYGKILVTGGAGYIGTHTCVELLESGYEVVVLDNLCNSSPVALERVQQITGKNLTFIEADIRDRNALDHVFDQHNIDAVIHFAGLKAVGESVEKPLDYYANNVVGSISLLEVMAKKLVKNIVFSSSATVYGEPASLPIREDFPLTATNPYGCSKLIIEDVLRDLHKADSEWNIAILRYFNPVGAHKSGMIGEDPKGIPSNLMPYIAQVAVGKLEELSVFGNNYPTSDGTGVRDYIHVVDLSRGHIRALKKLTQTPGCVTYNLGTGTGYSVLEMIRTFEVASNRTISFRIAPRRSGDIAVCYADPSLANQELGWKAQYGLDRMCDDAWRWQINNQDGFSTANKDNNHSR